MSYRTKYLKFPFRFDTKKLDDDLAFTINKKWSSHINTSVYSGDWKVISKYANEGNRSNIFTLSTSKSIILETEIIRNCHYFKEKITTN